jgi:hypothetical protein
MRSDNGGEYNVIEFNNFSNKTRIKLHLNEIVLWSKEIHHSWKQPSALLFMETFPNIFGKNLSTLCPTCKTKDYQRPWHKNTIGSV